MAGGLLVLSAMKSEASPHDTLFKAAFLSLLNTTALLRAVLPTEIAGAVDWSTLVRDSATYVQDSLRQLHGDLLFIAQLHDGDLRIAFPLEHQSSLDHHMLFRFQNYLTHSWMRGVTDFPGRPLPYPVPVLVTNVSGGWRAATRLEELFDPGLARLPELAGLVQPPSLSLTVVDLMARSDVQLDAMALPPFAALVLWALRDGRHKKRLFASVPHWASALASVRAGPNGFTEIAQLSRYFVDVTPRLTLDELHARLYRVIPGYEEITMTIAEQLRKEGRILGRQEGRQEGRADMLRRQLIVKFADVSPELDAKLSAATEAQLDRYAERVLTAMRIEAVFEE